MDKKVSLYLSAFFAGLAIIAIFVLYMKKEEKPSQEGGEEESEEEEEGGETKENFAGLGVSFKAKADPELRGESGYFYSVPPNLQAALAPRFSGTASYGPYLNQQMPSRNMQGVPVNPLTYQNTIKKCNASSVENYDGSGMGDLNGIKRCNAVSENFETVPPDFSAANYGASEAKLQARQNLIVNDMLPEMSAEASASVAQPIIYDRLIYANQRSRLYGLGDPIRGDLPIVPYSGDWFRPSVQPNIDLRDGAMMAMGGQDNQTARNTMALMRQSSGNSLSTFAGAPVMATQTNIGYSAAGADVIATAFP